MSLSVNFGTYPPFQTITYSFNSQLEDEIGWSCNNTLVNYQNTVVDFVLYSQSASQLLYSYVYAKESVHPRSC